MQLLWLAGFILALVLGFLGLSKAIFPDSSTFKWQEIIGMLLDPGVFGGESGKHDVFRLIVTLFGVLFFAAGLISVISNIFENISESYKKGETRYSFKDHVLVLGANHLLLGMLVKLREKVEKDKSLQIVVMTTRPVEELRDRLEAYFGKGKFMRHITLYFDERDEEDNLKKADADKASAIYVIGEDGEDNHDAVSLKCLASLKSLCQKSEHLKKNPSHVISCRVVLESQTTMSIFHFTDASDNTTDGNLHVDILHANEYEAEQVLATDWFPNIDRSRDAEGNVVEGIGPDSEQSVHFVIFGLTPMGRAFATSAANLMHYPNFKDGKHRSRITFVGERIHKSMDDFTSRYANLFKMSHSTYVRYDEDGTPIVRTKGPDEGYGDFMDIEWEFIEAHPSFPAVRKYLQECCADRTRTLSIAVCYGTSSENTALALHLPKEVFDPVLKIPVFIHIRDFNDVVDKAMGTGHFGNLYPFGAASAGKSDPLFEERARCGQRVNFIYNQQGFDSRVYGSPEEAWYSSDCKEWGKLSSIYSGISAYVKARSFPAVLDPEKKLTDAEIDALCELEHRRWTMAEFLLGFSAPDEAEKKAMLELREKDRKAYKEKKKARKKNDYVHHDMIPFADLEPSDKSKDYKIVNNIRYILGRTDKMDLSDRPERTGD